MFSLLIEEYIYATVHVKILNISSPGSVVVSEDAVVEIASAVVVSLATLVVTALIGHILTDVTVGAPSLLNRS